jgi:hypothetical protein
VEDKVDGRRKERRHQEVRKIMVDGRRKERRRQEVRKESRMEEGRTATVSKV